MWCVPEHQSSCNLQNVKINRLLYLSRPFFYFLLFPLSSFLSSSTSPLPSSTQPSPFLHPSPHHVSFDLQLPSFKPYPHSTHPGLLVSQEYLSSHQLLSQDTHHLSPARKHEHKSRLTLTVLPSIKSSPCEPPLGDKKKGKLRSSHRSCTRKQDCLFFSSFRLHRQWCGGVSSRTNFEGEHSLPDEKTGIALRKKECSSQRRKGKKKGAKK